MPVKSVPIQLDRRRHLRLDFNAFAAMQRECGLTLADIQKFANLVAVKTPIDAISKLPLYEMRGFIWAGLLHETPDITIEEVGELLEAYWLDDPAAIVEALGTAIMESFFVKAAEKKGFGPKMTTPKARKTGAKRISSKRATDLP
jgi:hypothetical protein